MTMAWRWSVQIRSGVPFTIRIAALMAFLSTPFSCQEPRPPSQFVEYDSAGIEIRDQSTSDLDSFCRWQVRLDSLFLRAFGLPPQGSLYQVRDLLELPTGEILVGNAGYQEILIFDGLGELIRRLGGPGDGPGEFRGLSDLLPLRGDSFGAFDALRRRLSVYARSGPVAREVSLKHLAEGFEGTRLLALSEGGLVLFTQAGLGMAKTAISRRAFTYSYRIDLNGAQLATYGPFPGIEILDSQYGPRPVWFGAHTLATTSGVDLVTSDGEGPEIKYWGPAGDLKRVVRLPDRDRRVTPSRMQEFLNQALASVPAEARERVTEQLRGIPFAPQEPPFDRLMGSMDGSLWIEEYSGPGASPPAREAPRHWIILDPNGKIIGRLSTPRGFLPYSAKRDILTGVFVDDLGVETLRRYQVLREEPCLR